MHNKKLKIFGLVVLFVVLGAVYLWWWQNKQYRKDIIWNNELESVSSELTEVSIEVNGTDESESTKLQEKEAIIYVYVCGCVKNPGVYQLAEGSRMFQAVEMAGGVLEEGDAGCLNMAGVLNDGERVYVPSYEEVKENPAQYAEWNSGNDSETSSGLININKATKEQLMTLPGIGEAKAEAIIQYREQEGGFSIIEDIMNISGIKEAAFSKIKSLICT